MKRELGIVMSVMKNAEKGYQGKSSRMVLQNLKEDLVKNIFWTALKGMSKKGLFIIEKA